MFENKTLNLFPFIKKKIGSIGCAYLGRIKPCIKSVLRKMSHEQETLHHMVNLGKGHYSIVREQ